MIPFLTESDGNGYISILAWNFVFIRFPISERKLLWVVGRSIGFTSNVCCRLTPSPGLSVFAKFDALV
jgi:hypothetical protein